jgi:DNA-binding response OmpR family regulator
MFGLFGKKKRATVLLVDDETSIVHVLRERLETCGYAVITAYNGREGLKKALRRKPDVVLLDNDMPIMSGKEMLERLRENPEGRNISVIMVTMASLIRDIEHADKCGVDDYIIKPFNTHDLILKIESILESKKISCSV